MRRVLVAVIAMLPVSVKAQCVAGTPILTAPSHTIVGLITNQALDPLPGALVSIVKPRLDRTADERGRLQIADLPPGAYELIIRKLGFEMERRTVTVADSGVVIHVCMTVAARPLPAIVTSASRIGLSGLVADASRRPVPGAEVRVVGTGAVTSTDSAGRFFIGVKGGHYAVQVSRSGYGQQLLGVTIPPDSGREIAVWLAAPPLNANRYAVELDSMHWRAVQLPAARYALRTAEDMARSQRSVMQEILAAAHGVKVCGVRVVGQAYDVPADVIQKQEVAMLEVITEWPGKPGRRTAPACARGVVWLK